MNFRTSSSFGYAFVNFPATRHAERCYTALHGFTDWGTASDRVCEVSWSDNHQGLADHIARYQNSPVMHKSVQDEYKPAIFKNGKRIAFPLPTKTLRAPRVRRSADGLDVDEHGRA
mmetsp:Transcript_111891/g.229102  ORF Transcript_111891/g.229102 Transcript_111891/m.229102 type:complete len:116 (-) Transcript_111891:76-423(-)